VRVRARTLVAMTARAQPRVACKDQALVHPNSDCLWAYPPLGLAALTGSSKKERPSWGSKLGR